MPVSQFGLLTLTGWESLVSHDDRVNTLTIFVGVSKCKIPLRYGDFAFCTIPYNVHLFPQYINRNLLLLTFFHLKWLRMIIFITFI